MHNLVLARRRRIAGLATQQPQLVRQTRIVHEQVSADAVPHRLRADGRAHALRVQRRALAGVLTHQVGELEHALRALGRVHAAPFALPGFVGGGDGGVDIGFAGRVDFVGDERIFVRVVDR